MCVCLCVYLCVFCICACEFGLMCTFVCVYGCLCAFLLMCVCLRACVRACVHVFMCACVRIRSHVCLLMSTIQSIHPWLKTHTYSYINTQPSLLLSRSYTSLASRFNFHSERIHALPKAVVADFLKHAPGPRYNKSLCQTACMFELVHNNRKCAMSL